MGLIQKYSQTLTNQAWKQKNLCRLSQTCEDKPQHMEHNTKVIVYFFCYLAFLSTRGLGGTANLDFSKDFTIQNFSTWCLHSITSAEQSWKTQNTLVEIFARGNVYEMSWRKFLRSNIKASSYRSPLVQGHWGDFQPCSDALWMQNTCHGWEKAVLDWLPIGFKIAKCLLRELLIWIRTNGLF